MKLKKRLSLNSRLYLILNKYPCLKMSLVDIFRTACKAGIDLVQLRENASCDREFLEDAKAIRRLCQKSKTIFLVNNRLDIARIVDADGLHLGQSDLPLKTARKYLNKNKLIGITCRNLPEARKAEAEGADYISIGPVFPSPTKPDLEPVGLELIQKIAAKIKIPFFVIGGITHSNINEAVKYGATRFALCGAICYARDIKKAVRELKKQITQLYALNSGRRKNDTN
ncbi:MAG: thiamine phosphate synthase [Candidatus Omnitrophota bacterium]